MKPVLSIETEAKDNNNAYELFDLNFMLNFTFFRSLSLNNIHCSKQGITTEIPLTSLEENLIPTDQLVNLFTGKCNNPAQKDLTKAPAANVRKRNVTVGKSRADPVKKPKRAKSLSLDSSKKEDNIKSEAGSDHPRRTT